MTVDNYMTSFVPSGEKRYSIMKFRMRGLNKSYPYDTGQLTGCSNILPGNAPYLYSVPSPALYKDGYEHPISLHGAGDALLMIYRDGGSIKADYIASTTSIYTGTIKATGATSSDDYRRSVTQFNVYTDPDDVLSGTFDRKILVFPDKLSMPFKPESNFNFSNISPSENPLPNLRYVTVQGSRLFGVDDDRIYASGFNDYSKWTLDTADEQSSANAWVTTAQSNVKSDGSFTGITTYDGKVVCFKRDFTHQLYNNKNPYRVMDISTDGAISDVAYAEAGGTLFFISPDNVKAYTGGNPVSIGTPLGITSFDGAVCGSTMDMLYVYKDGYIYTYNPDIGEWGAMRFDKDIICFAQNKVGLYCLTSDGGIYKIDGDTYGDYWFSTDVIAAGRIDVRRASKLSILCELGENSNINVYLLEEGEEKTNESALVLSSDVQGKRLLRGLVRGKASTAYRIYVEGTGSVKIYAAELRYSYAGDVYETV
jgi:hypothetical protein